MSISVRILRRPEAVAQPRSLTEISDKSIKDVAHLPKCQAKRSTRYCGTWEAEHPDKTCSRSARYEINGVPLCGTHAGEVVLRHALTTEDT